MIFEQKIAEICFEVAESKNKAELLFSSDFEDLGITIVEYLREHLGEVVEIREEDVLSILKLLKRGREGKLGSQSMPKGFLTDDEIAQALSTAQIFKLKE